MNACDSFLIGFNYGRFNGRELSVAEIAVQFPDVEPEAFAQGNAAGVRNDRVRLELELELGRRRARFGVE